MKTPHIHADVIKAWADGETIQYWRAPYGWEDTSGNDPAWCPDAKYRVKPVIMPDRVEEMTVYRNMHRRYEDVRPYDEPVIAGALANVRVTFCGNTGVVKSMEVL
jgi:hypothetical protein